jgi:hypothetical protein
MSALKCALRAVQSRAEALPFERAAAEEWLSSVTKLVNEKETGTGNLTPV